MTKTTNLKIRRYDLDWLRVLAILIVLFYHVGMFFVSWDFHIKNNDTSNWLSLSLEHLMVWLHQWRMPLLLLISGAGTIFATSRRTTKQFVIERHKRLFIPLLFAMFVIVPPQIYVEKANQFNGYIDFYKSVFDLIPYPAGNFSWHHMWFVLYLLFFSMIAIPLISFLKKEKSINFLTKVENYCSKKWGYLSFILAIIATQVMLRPFFPNETHDLINDWAYFVFYFLFFIAGIIIASSERLWQILKDHRRFHLIVGIISLAIMEIIYSNWTYDLQLFPFDIGIVWDINNIIAAWSWVITVVGYGQVYLNKKSKLLQFSNEGIYPFYILHQTVILVLAAPMINWEINVFNKFLLLLISSFTITVVLYLTVVKPFNITRFLFGMKPKPVTNSEKETDIVMEKV